MTVVYSATSLDAGPGVRRPVSYAIMLCAICASPIPDGGHFCLNCGADVSHPSSPSTASLDDVGVAKLTRMLRQETAGEYEIEREIGRGGMGVVYLATEIQLRRRVAIKVLPPALTFGERTIQRFRREARTAAALDHPNIIPIYRVSSGGELVWYSMKLLEGRSLDSVLKDQGTLALDETTALLDQVADALDYAHQRGVIHRDIKPGNIVLDDRGRVTVTDFGIAKEIQEGAVTTAGALLGTPYYMPPEQYVGGEISGAADQYSLGVVAYQCLTGKVPFDASTAYELLSKHVSEPPPPLELARPGLPPHAGGAIRRALAKQPESRFLTVAEFANALAGRGPQIPIVQKPRLNDPRRLVRWGAALALAAGTLYGGLAALRGRSPHNPSDVSSMRAGEQTAVPTGAVSTPDSVAPLSPPAQRLEHAAVRPTHIQAPAAVLIIRLTSGWARIYVDGELRGERPVHREHLPPGTHTLRFERPEYLSTDTTVALVAGENVVEIRMRRPAP